MTNLEVAQCFISNALAYAKGGDMKTVIENLKYIDQLLENPNDENTEHDWEDFK